MKPLINSTKDWQVGINKVREEDVALEILKIFSEFWYEASIEKKSKSTVNRYRAALQSLGGYIVEKSVTDDDSIRLNANELIFESINEDGGPLVFHDNEAWQNELDMVCRKLHKFLQKGRV